MAGKRKKVVKQNKLDLKEVKKYIEKAPKNSKIYIGCDSECRKKKGKWYADYITVVVIHIAGKHGCKIFGEIITERDYVKQIHKPTLRLMNEVYKVSELYLKLIEVIGEMEVEVHLDINPDDQYNSNIVLSQAVGYIKGVCGVDPKVKPEAFAASYAADRLARRGHFRSVAVH